MVACLFNMQERDSLILGLRFGPTVTAREQRQASGSLASCTLYGGLSLYGHGSIEETFDVHAYLSGYATSARNQGEKIDRRAGVCYIVLGPHRWVIR